MKYVLNTINKANSNVAPLVGAWIEIRQTANTFQKLKVAPLVGAWIEIKAKGGKPVEKKSRSSRRSVD